MHPRVCASVCLSDCPTVFSTLHFCPFNHILRGWVMSYRVSLFLCWLSTTCFKLIETHNVKSNRICNVSFSKYFVNNLQVIVVSYELQILIYKVPSMIIAKLSHSPICSIAKPSRAEVSFIIIVRPPTHPTTYSPNHPPTRGSKKLWNKPYNLIYKL